jgi:branched-chain amino acid aminotransferase
MEKTTMAHSGSPNFDFEKNPNSLPASERDELLKNPAWGRVFTDHMITIKYSEERGWHDGKLGQRRTFSIDPAGNVLHYAMEIFEGMKAYRLPDG